MGAKDLRDYKPANLVRNWYKWQAKVLANRLGKVEGEVVSVKRRKKVSIIFYIIAGYQSSFGSCIVVSLDAIWLF